MTTFHSKLGSSPFSISCQLKGIDHIIFSGTFCTILQKEEWNSEHYKRIRWRYPKASKLVLSVSWRKDRSHHILTFSTLLQTQWQNSNTTKESQVTPSKARKLVLSVSWRKDRSHPPGFYRQNNKTLNTQFLMLLSNQLRYKRITSDSIPSSEALLIGFVNEG